MATQTQHNTLTKEAILRKVNRKRNPVESIAGLAREFGWETTYDRHSDPIRTTGEAAPLGFRTKVKKLVGARTYNKIRQSKAVNRQYR